MAKAELQAVDDIYVSSVWSCFNRSAEEPAWCERCLWGVTTHQVFYQHFFYSYTVQLISSACGEMCHAACSVVVVRHWTIRCIYFVGYNSLIILFFFIYAWIWIHAGLFFAQFMVQFRPSAEWSNATIR